MDMEWIKVKDELPELKHEIENSEDKWKASNYVVCISDYGLEIAKYEKGENWEQWYSPAYDDAMPDPAYWLPLPEKPKL